MAKVDIFSWKTEYGIRRRFLAARVYFDSDEDNVELDGITKEKAIEPVAGFSFSCQVAPVLLALARQRRQKVFFNWVSSLCGPNVGLAAMNPNGEVTYEGPTEFAERGKMQVEMLQRLYRGS